MPTTQEMPHSQRLTEPYRPGPIFTVHRTGAPAFAAAFWQRSSATWLP